MYKSFIRKSPALCLFLSLLGPVVCLAQSSDDRANADALDALAADWAQRFEDEYAAGSKRGKLANKRQARRFSYVAETIPQSYSITLSARSKIDGGIVIGSAFAVLRFTTNSDLVGCSIGSSAGFAPLAIRSTYPAAHANMTVKPGP